MCNPVDWLAGGSLKAATFDVAFSRHDPLSSPIVTNPDKSNMLTDTKQIWDVAPCQWPFQEPKLEVPTVCKAYIRPM